MGGEWEGKEVRCLHRALSFLEGSESALKLHLPIGLYREYQLGGKRCGSCQEALDLVLEPKAVFNF